jgi:hypothetical protein
MQCRGFREPKFNIKYHWNTFSGFWCETCRQWLTYPLYAFTLCFLWTIKYSREIQIIILFLFTHNNGTRGNGQRFVIADAWSLYSIRGEGLVSLWLYKENNKLWDWKKIYIYSTYSPLSSTHLWLRYFNFFNPSKKHCSGYVANRKTGNRKSQKRISIPTYSICIADGHGSNEADNLIILGKTGTIHPIDWSRPVSKQITKHIHINAYCCWHQVNSLHHEFMFLRSANKTL